MNIEVFLSAIFILNTARYSLSRPFTVHGKSRTTFSQTCNIDTCTNRKHAESWKMGPPPSISPNSSYNQEIGRRWLEQAESEHAALAAFARNTLLLMHLGSPPGLLTSSQEAGIDKINHAKLCYGFASAFIGDDLVPGPLNVEGCLDEVDLKTITQLLIKDGCFEETILAIEAQVRAQNAQDPAIKAALTTMASDNLKHVQLAWDSLEWIMEKYPEIRSFVAENFRVELERNRQKFECQSLKKDLPLTCSKPCTDSEETKMLRKYGLLVENDRDQVRQTGIRDIIEPVYRAGFKDIKLMSKRISKVEIVAF